MGQLANVLCAATVHAATHDARQAKLPSRKHRNALTNTRISDLQTCVESDTPQASQGGREEHGRRPALPHHGRAGLRLPLDRTIYISGPARGFSRRPTSRPIRVEPDGRQTQIPWTGDASALRARVARRPHVRHDRRPHPHTIPREARRRERGPAPPSCCAPRHPTPRWASPSGRP